MPTANNNRHGTVITFYSFKGGVGRSMALANLAVLLARADRRVLCIDWDLEAPGLDRYFRAIPRSAPNAIPSLSEPVKSGGLLTILDTSSPDSLTQWRDYTRTRIGADNTRLDLIGSGDDAEDYPSRLGAFSWQEFFNQRKGGDIIESIRNEWKKDYDYVLVDSRTGLTDSSGVCSIQMPDLLVMLFAANDQNVDWCRRIAQSIRSGRSKLPYDRTFLPIIPLLSRFDAREESDRASEAMDRIAEHFAPFFSDWLPRSITARDMLAWSVLPYVPRYSFEEALAVEDEPATGAQGLSFYYQLLSRLILARFNGVRAILASVGVPGAALPPLLPSRSELDSELRRNPASVERYSEGIRQRAEEEPLEATEAFESLDAACASISRLRDAARFLNEAIALVSDPAVARSDEVSRLREKRAEILASIGESRFRIAFSFAGETRNFVAKVADILAQRLGQEKILYDQYHEAELARPNLSTYLPDLYNKQSDLVVVVIDRDYKARQWSGLEWTAILDLLKKRRDNEVMLCRFEHAEVKGLYSTAGFVELDDKTPEQTATLILQRLALNEGQVKDYYTTNVTAVEGPPVTTIPNNLPRLAPFFGRTEELMRIGEALDPDARTWGALIDGPGGMGKTSLAVRAAYNCPPDQFQRIIFLSVKDLELDEDGERAAGNFILPGFLEMLNELARELARPDITKAAEKDRIRLLLDALGPAKALLILDNLESLTKDDRDQLLTFVKRLPQGCKAILTSRRRIGSSADLLILEKLDQKSALEFVADIAKHNPLLAKTSKAERISLYKQTDGNPLLLRWTAGQLGRGSCRTIADALAFLRSCPPDNDPLEFTFGDLANEFTAVETQVLVALTYFTLPAKIEHIATIASLDEELVETALRSLANRSLVVPDQEEKSFALVPMVADFLRRKRPEVVAETGNRLEQQAYALIVENGYENHDRFPLLDAAWPTVAPALPLFVAGPNLQLQTVCDALDEFFEFTGRWDERITLNQQAEAKAVAAGDHDSAGWRAFRAGYTYYLREQADAVWAWAESATAHWETAKAGARERAIALQLRAHGHRLKADYAAASLDYRESLALFRNLSSESEDVAIALNWLGNVEKTSGDLDAAERDFGEALLVARAVNYIEGVSYITGNLADLALRRQDWFGAETLAREALTLSEKVGRLGLIAGISRLLARTLLRQGKRDEALPYAKRAVDIYMQLRQASDLKVARKTLEECEAQS